MKKTAQIEVRLPKQVADEVAIIAKLAGLSPQSVVKVMLATEIRRHTKSPQKE